MRGFTVHHGLAVPLLRRDIDTDQIIPKQFLKSVERQGFGRFLFNDWRFDADGSPRPEFPLNQPRYAGASILITGANFGCGSSREHAAWALDDFGIRAVIAPSFADIFRANAISNAILPLALPEIIVRALAESTETVERYTITIDLAARRLRDGHGADLTFEIDETARHRLMRGLDDIALVLEHEAAIAAYETISPPIQRRF